MAINLSDPLRSRTAHPENQTSRTVPKGVIDTLVAQMVADSGKTHHLLAEPGIPKDTVEASVVHLPELIAKHADPDGYDPKEFPHSDGHISPLQVFVRESTGALVGKGDWHPVKKEPGSPHPLSEQVEEDKKSDDV